MKLTGITLTEFPIVKHDRACVIIEYSYSIYTYLNISIVSIVSASPTIERMEPMIVRIFKASVSPEEITGAFTFFTDKTSYHDNYRLI